jgi:hypothetical protein
MRRSFPFLAVVLGTAALSAPGARAQALAFERVGDRPISANDLAFEEDGTLWAIRSYVWRLPPGGTAWEEVTLVSGSYILPLDPDTLLAGNHHVLRSLDGGQTWVEVSDDGEQLFEAPASGTLLAGMRTSTGVLYSHDRGATWAPGQINTGTWSPFAEAFAEIPPAIPTPAASSPGAGPASLTPTTAG